MRAKVPGVLLAIGSLLAVAGITAGLLGVVQGMNASGEAWRTPGARDLDLSAGRWVVYEATRSNTDDPVIRARQVAVYGPTGPLQVDCISCGGSQESLTLGTQDYVGVVAFSVTQPGQYKVTVTHPGATVMVAPSVGRSLLTFMGGFLLAAVGAVIAFIALVWLVIAAATSPG